MCGPVKFLLEGAAHYGWIRYEGIDLASAMIIDWAYEDEFRQGIRAGDTGSEPTCFLEATAD